MILLDPPPTPAPSPKPYFRDDMLEQISRIHDNLAAVSALLRSAPSLNSLRCLVHADPDLPPQVTFNDLDPLLAIVGREELDTEENHSGGFDVVKVLHGVRLVVRNAWAKPEGVAQ